jgi:hypothetical protein
MTTDLNLAQPAPAMTTEEWNEWNELRAKIAGPIADDIAREMELRKKVAACYFPTPKEGVNDVPLSDGFVMKLTHKVNRKIVVDALVASTDEFVKAGLPLADLVVNKPELSGTEYKKLTPEQQALFDKVLEIKPASPSIAITKPKK